jgi:hypothetical protein
MKLLFFKERLSLLQAIIAIVVYLTGLYIFPYYTFGDQFHYNKVYHEIGNINIRDAFIYYQAHLSSKELIHFLLTWTTSSMGIKKDVVMSLSNAALAYYAISVMRKMHVAYPIAIIIVTTNFYFMVLYFSAERLKYGILFSIISMLYINNIRQFIVISMLSVVSHVQMLLVYSSIGLRWFLVSVYGFMKTLKLKKALIIYPIIIIALLYVGKYLLQQHIITKYESYYQSFNFSISALPKVIIFMIASIWYSKNKIETMLLFVPIIFATYIVGGERINILAYLLFLYSMLRVNNGKNIPIYASSLYFAIKGYYFISKVIQHGNGFF